MIKSFKHRGLKRLYEQGDARHIGADMLRRVERILALLDQAETVDELDLPGYRLHPLRGSRRENWSMRVSGNWRVTFVFEDGNVYNVNLEDYH